MLVGQIGERGFGKRDGGGRRENRIGLALRRLAVLTSLRTFAYVRLRDGPIEVVDCRDWSRVNGCGHRDRSRGEGLGRNEKLVLSVDAADYSPENVEKLLTPKEGKEGRWKLKINGRPPVAHGNELVRYETDLLVGRSFPPIGRNFLEELQGLALPHGDLVLPCTTMEIVQGHCLQIALCIWWFTGADFGMKFVWFFKLKI